MNVLEKEFIEKDSSTVCISLFVDEITDRLPFCVTINVVVLYPRFDTTLLYGKVPVVYVHLNAQFVGLSFWFYNSHLT